nr:hypothetical protein [Nocardiopsis alborubida]
MATVRCTSASSFAVAMVTWAAEAWRSRLVTPSRTTRARGSAHCRGTGSPVTVQRIPADLSSDRAPESSSPQVVLSSPRTTRRTPVPASSARTRIAVISVAARSPWPHRTSSEASELLSAIVAGDLPRGIGAPATRAPAEAGLTTLEQVAALTEAELSALHGVGPEAVRILREAMGERGLSPR